MSEGHAGQTLEQLEGVAWETPSRNDSHVVTETYRLRKVPLSDFTVENLRIMIGQGIGLDHLVPIALGKLGKDPWIQGDFFEGDLLLTILRIPDQFWSEYPSELQTLTDVMTRLERRREIYEAELNPAWLKIFGGA